MQTPRMTSIMYVLMKRHLLILLALCPTAFAGSVRFYVGTYTDKSPSQGIYTGLLNTDSGKISSLELAAKTTSIP
jgi:hypothetical protein